MQTEGALPWEVTCQYMVDGIAIVFHTTRRGGSLYVEEAIRVSVYDAVENRWITEFARRGSRPGARAGSWHP